MVKNDEFAIYIFADGDDFAACKDIGAKGVGEFGGDDIAGLGVFFG